MPNRRVQHDYHLVDPSPWPVVGALGAFVMLVGAGLWLNTTYVGFGVLAGIPWIFAIGLALVVYTVAGWLRDVVQESVVRREHSPVVKLGFHYGMVLALLAEVVFFGAWIWAWLHFGLYPKDAGLTAWPPVAAIDPWRYPLLQSVLLLTSGATLQWGLHAIRAGDKAGALAGLGLTVVMGFAAIALQVMILCDLPFSFGFNGAKLGALTDAAHAAMSPAQGNLTAIFGSAYGMVTGLYAALGLIGVLFLTICLGRVIAGHFSSSLHFGVVAAAWNWQVLIGLWLVLFAAVYLIA